MSVCADWWWCCCCGGELDACLGSSSNGSSGGGSSSSFVRFRQQEGVCRVSAGLFQHCGFGAEQQTDLFLLAQMPQPPAADVSDCACMHGHAWTSPPSLHSLLCAGLSLPCLSCCCCCCCRLPPPRHAGRHCWQCDEAECHQPPSHKCRNGNRRGVGQGRAQLHQVGGWTLGGLTAARVAAGVKDTGAANAAT